jgi:hypothetical protein
MIPAAFMLLGDAELLRGIAMYAAALEDVCV